MNLIAELRAGIEDEIAFHGSIVPLPLFSERVVEGIPPNSPVHSLNTLEEVAQYVDQTILTPIDGLRTSSVPGKGNPNADMVVIGEAPGAEEDRRGEPFVGRAGKLLTKILEAIELDRDEIFITNILKSRPPKNRNPKPDEIEAHFPVLLRQLSLIKPKVLCCLGKFSGNTMLGTTQQTLKSMRGHKHWFYGIPLYVTYHPAFLLRNANYKRATWQDVQMLRKEYDAQRNP